MRTPPRVRIYARYFRHLLWEFRWALGIFLTLILGGGFLLHR